MLLTPKPTNSDALQIGTTSLAIIAHRMLHRQREEVLPEVGQQAEEDGVMDNPLSAAEQQVLSDTSTLKMNRVSLWWTIRPALSAEEVQCLVAEVDLAEDPVILPEETLREAAVLSLQDAEVSEEHEEVGEIGKRYAYVQPSHIALSSCTWFCSRDARVNRPWPFLLSGQCWKKLSSTGLLNCAWMLTSRKSCK